MPSFHRATLHTRFVHPPCHGFCLLAAVFAAFVVTGCTNPLRRAGRIAANRAGSGESNSAAQTSAANAVSATHLGTVHVIGTGQRFVLVQTPSNQSAANITDGQALVCRAAGMVTATLRASHERRPPFMVADVASGEPHVGDEVFLDPAPGGAAIPDSPHPAPPASTASPAPAATPDFRANPVLPPTR